MTAVGAESVTVVEVERLATEIEADPSAPRPRGLSTEIFFEKGCAATGPHKKSRVPTKPNFRTKCAIPLDKSATLPTLNNRFRSDDLDQSDFYALGTSAVAH
jgi:hypothetical protein